MRVAFGLRFYLKKECPGRLTVRGKSESLLVLVTSYQLPISATSRATPAFIGPGPAVWYFMNST